MWSTKYSFTKVRGNPVYSVCGEQFAVFKEDNLSRQYEIKTAGNTVTRLRLREHESRKTLFSSVYTFRSARRRIVCLSFGPLGKTLPSDNAHPSTNAIPEAFRPNSYQGY